MESYTQPHRFMLSKKFWKKLAKKILILIVLLIQIIHAERLLVEFLKELKGGAEHPKQALILLEHCFTFNCQFIIRLGNGVAKSRKKSYSKPRSTKETV